METASLTTGEKDRFEPTHYGLRESTILDRRLATPRVHASLTIDNEDGTRTEQTPAMAAGVVDHVWTLREIAALLDGR